jgi:dienelactone hydrolase
MPQVAQVARLLVAGVLLLWCGAGAAQELVHFPSLEDNGAGRPSTTLDGYVFRPAGEGRHPAVVFLHGCGGLFSRTSGMIGTRERDWARDLNQRGYVVLMVDSFGPRNQGEMCSQQGFDREVYLKRPRDAYGALLFLQSQSHIRPDRIGMMGWSEGGGAVLFAIRAQSLGRPARLPQGDFRVAVAFYPASCSERRQQGWTSAIPLLALLGAEDVWTPAAPCKELLDGAAARGAKVEMQIYPGAYHDFDWPNMPRHESPNFRTAAGVVPIQGTDPAARQDALSRVPAFLARFLMN